MRATRDVAPDVSIYIEAVHRLSDLGAVVTPVANGTSQEGFDAEWRMIGLFTVEGDLISRLRDIRRGRPRRRARAASRNFSHRRGGWKTRRAKRRALIGALRGR